jgi:hypothetical protein
MNYKVRLGHSRSDPEPTLNVTFRVRVSEHRPKRPSLPTTPSGTPQATAPCRLNRQRSHGPTAQHSLVALLHPHDEPVDMVF